MPLGQSSCKSTTAGERPAARSKSGFHPQAPLAYAETRRSNRSPCAPPSHGARTCAVVRLMHGPGRTLFCRGSSPTHLPSPPGRLSLPACPPAPHSITLRRADATQLTSQCPLRRADATEWYPWHPPSAAPTRRMGIVMSTLRRADATDGHCDVHPASRRRDGWTL